MTKVLSEKDQAKADLKTKVDALKKMNAEMADKIKFHKQNHSVVHSIVVDDKYCLLRKPDRNTYETALGLITPIGDRAPKFVTAGQRILQACWLDGDKDILSNDELLVAFAMQAIGLVQIAGGVLKKN